MNRCAGFKEQVGMELLFLVKSRGRLSRREGVIVGNSSLGFCTTDLNMRLLGQAVCEFDEGRLNIKWHFFRGKTCGSRVNRKFQMGKMQ